MAVARATFDFFEAQRSARRRTALLLLYYLLALPGVAIAVYLAVRLGAGLGSTRPSTTSPSGGRSSSPRCWSSPPWWWGAARSTTPGRWPAAGARGWPARWAASRSPLQPVTEEDQRLRNVVEEMAIAAGLPVPTLYVLRGEPGINAFAAGFAPDRAVVAVTQGCLTQLTRDELQGVIGHELSHVQNGDMRLNLRLLALAGGLSALALVGRVLMQAGSSGSRRRGKGGSGQLALVGLLVLIGRRHAAPSSPGSSGPRWPGSASTWPTPPPPSSRATRRRWPAPSARSPRWARRSPAPWPPRPATCSSPTGGCAAGWPTTPRRSRASAGCWRSARPRRCRPSSGPRPGPPPPAGPPPRHRRWWPPWPAHAAPTAARPRRRRPHPGSPPRPRCSTGCRPSWPPPPASPSAPAPSAARCSSTPAPRCGRGSWPCSAPGPQGSEVLRLAPHVATVARAQRLALLDLALPALGALSAPQRERLQADLRRLAEADGRLSVTEWVYLRVVARRLDRLGTAGRPARPRAFTVDQVAVECRELLGLLARVGADGEPAAQAALDTGRGRARPLRPVAAAGGRRAPLRPAGPGAGDAGGDALRAARPGCCAPARPAPPPTGPSPRVNSRCCGRWPTPWPWPGRRRCRRPGDPVASSRPPPGRGASAMESAPARGSRRAAGPRRDQGSRRARRRGEQLQDWRGSRCGARRPWLSAPAGGGCPGPRGRCGPRTRCSRRRTGRAPPASAPARGWRGRPRKRRSWETKIMVPS